MTVCSFFLQGRCRYGDKCWNEHPRGGSASGGGGGFRNNSYNRSAPQQQPRQGTGGEVATSLGKSLKMNTFYPYFY